MSNLDRISISFHAVNPRVSAPKRNTSKMICMHVGLSLLIVRMLVPSASILGSEHPIGGSMPPHLPIAKTMQLQIRRSSLPYQEKMLACRAKFVSSFYSCTAHCFEHQAVQSRRGLDGQALVANQTILLVLLFQGASHPSG